MQRRTLLRGLPALGAAACGWSAAAPAAGTVLRFGQSASLSGGQMRYGEEVRTGIAAAFQAANNAEAARDGAKALRFELQTLDDGGVRERGVANVKQLIDGGVTGLIGLTSGAIAEAALPLVEQAQVALLGTASGNMGIRRATQGVCHVRAGYDTEFRRIVGYLKDFGMRRVGYVHLQDTSAANLTAMQQALQDAKVQPAVTVAIDRNSPNFDAAARALLAEKLDSVLFTTNAKPILHTADKLAAANFGGMLFASSFAGQDLIDGIGSAGRSVVMSLVVPRPTALGLGVVNQCKQDLAALGNGARLGITTLEGYIAGRVAVEAARAAARSGHAQRAGFREALAALQVDLGGYRVQFGSQHGTQGSQYVDMVVINRHGHIVG